MKSHYQKFYKNLTCIIICTCTFLFTAKTFSQERKTLSISEKTYQYMKDNNLRLWVVQHDTVASTKRPMLILANTIVDSATAIGTYSATLIDYRYATRTNTRYDYVINELVDKSNKYYYDLSSDKTFYGWKNDITGTLYVLEEQDMVKINIFSKTQELVKIVNKLGYKEYKSNDRYDENLYIKSKACEIKLNNWTYNELKKNPSYITTLDNHQMKLDALTKQTIPHSTTLDKYIRLYRIQRNKMSTANINAWKSATAQAQKLNNQMVKLAEKYAGDYSFMPLNNLSNISEIFSDNLGASKGVLGM